MHDWAITVEAEFEDDEAYDGLNVYTEAVQAGWQLKRSVEDCVMSARPDRSEFDGHMVTFNVKISDA